MRQNRNKEVGIEVRIKKAKKVLNVQGMVFDSLLGTGTFGDVLQVEDLKSRTKKAVKVIQTENTSEGELSIWPELDHPNVLPLEKILRTTKVDLFVMPLHRKPLDAILREDSFRNNPDAFKMSVGWLKDIAAAIDYLHGRNNCHLDLKTNNVLIAKDMKAIVCDFSSLNVMDQPVSCALPQLFRPPEAFVKVDGKAPKLYGGPFDVWSCGMLALCMWTKDWFKTQRCRCISWKEGIYPALFQSLEPEFFSRLVRQNFCQASVSDEYLKLALNFIQSTLRYDPAERPSSGNLLQHGLFTCDASKQFPSDIMWSTFNEFRFKVIVEKESTDSVLLCKTNDLEVELDNVLHGSSSPAALSPEKELLHEKDELARMATELVVLSKTVVDDIFCESELCIDISSSAKSKSGKLVRRKKLTAWLVKILKKIDSFQ